MAHDDTLGGLLPDGVDSAESADLEATWRMLAAIPAPAPDTGRMRARLDATMDVIQQPHAIARPRLLRSYAIQGLAAAAVLLIGIAIGWLAASARSSTASSNEQMAAMRGELRDLREMVSLSLMQQPSASERLKGVSWTGNIDRPSAEVVSALLDALMHDPNVNVRLATIDALERFASRDDVRRDTVQAVQQQRSPLVQIALIDFMVTTNDRQSAPVLRRLSMDPQVNDAVRARAAWGLQQLG
jgi:hypothetical protein